MTQLIGAGAAIVGKALGVGNNDTKVEKYQTDPNSYEYNGQKGGATAAEGAATTMGDDANRRLTGLGQGIDASATDQGKANAALANGLAAKAANGAAPTINYGMANTDAGQAANMGGLGIAARGSQQNALALQQQAALGQAPSVAQLQMQQGNDAAIRSQQALAASARGPAALAMAQSNAAGNTAALQQQNVAQTGQLRAQEMSDARNAYMSGASTIRAGDVTAQGADTNASNVAGAQAIAQGNISEAQNTLNQAGNIAFTGMGMTNALGYDTMGANALMGGATAGATANANAANLANNIATAQMTGQANKEATNAGIVNNVNNQAIGVGQSNANNDMNLFKMGIGGIAGAAAAGDVTTQGLGSPNFGAGSGGFTGMSAGPGLGGTSPSYNAFTGQPNPGSGLDTSPFGDG